MIVKRDKNKSKADENEPDVFTARRVDDVASVERRRRRRRDAVILRRRRFRVDTFDAAHPDGAAVAAGQTLVVLVAI